MSEGTVKPSKAKVFLSRLLSTVIMYVLVTAVFMSESRKWFTVLVASLALIALIEILKMAGEKIHRSAHYLTMVVSGAYILAIYYHKGGVGMAEVAGLGVLSLLSFAIAMRRAPKGEETLVEVVVPLIAFVLVPLMFFGSSMRLIFDVPGAGVVPGAWLMLWLVLVTKFSDMGAYITGSLVGKRKMIPHISPGKTWEGLIGGFVFTQLAGCGMYALAGGKLTVFSGWAEVIVLGIVLCAVAVVGDLAESVLKRSLVVKDSGSTLPGIGGILDLIDSVCFTAPVLWLWLEMRGVMIY